MDRIATDQMVPFIPTVCQDYGTGAMVPYVPRLYGTPKILPGEAVSGWLYRVSGYHRLSLYALRRLLTIGGSFSRLDFGSHLTPAIAFDIASVTLNSPSTILAAVSPAMAVLANKDYRCLTVDLATMVPIYRVCSECLTEDDVPYVRRTWRIAYNLVCDCHAQGLIDRCRQCRQPFDFSVMQPHRLSKGDRLTGVRYCGHCGADQADKAKKKLDETLWLRLRRFQDTLNEVVVSGVLRHPRYGTISAALALESYLTTELVDKGDEAISRFSAIDFRRCFGVHAAEILEAIWPCRPTRRAK